MTRPARPIRLAAAEEHSAWGGTRLQRVLGRRVLASPSSRLVESDGRHWVVTWFDTTGDSPVMHCHTEIALHLLWSASAGGIDIGAGLDPQDASGLARFTAQPGDTVGIPGSTPFAIGRGSLAIAIGSSPIEFGHPLAVPGLPVQPPTHGLNLFQRFNRRTICLATPDLLLDRWKLTQPIDLILERERTHLLVNLVEPVGMVWQAGSDLAPRASTWLIPAGTGTLTVVPDNLGYILLARVPDLARDVVGPLRSAGYDNAAITGIGVPPGCL